MSQVELSIKKYRQEGDMAHEYNPLRNMMDSDNAIQDFNTDELSIDLNNPLILDCQPSYDGTVNLIINDDKNPPRIINTRFSRLEDNRYKIINRNQLYQTNIYKENYIDQQTRLFRNIRFIPRIDLSGINYTGQLKGGTYTFYIKLADNDYNKTDVVAESGQVSIFKGTIGSAKSVSGTLIDERTDKSITLSISNIDTTFSNFYVYFVREFGDMNGSRTNEILMIKKPYKIKNKIESITINGYEETTVIADDELNIKYEFVTNVKTQAQVQNMLFFGNVQGTLENTKDLQNISYFIEVALKQKSTSIGWLDKDYSIKESDDLSQTEYYNPQNIYYNLGYWPDEIYRLGIVYIMNDDSLSSVYCLRGCNFDSLSTSNSYISNLSNRDVSLFDENGDMKYLERDDFITDGEFLDNTMGVFKNPGMISSTQIQNYTTKETKPWYYEIKLSDDLLTLLKKYNVKGYFFVRQKRLPTTLFQGLSIGVDRTSYIPMLYDDTNKEYFTESFISADQLLTNDFTSHRISTKNKETSGLLSLDPNINSTLQSTLDGSSFVLKKIYENGSLSQFNRHFSVDFNGKTFSNSDNATKVNAIFIDQDVPLKYVNNYGYSTRSGAAEDVKQLGFFDGKNYEKETQNLVRGIYCPYIGLDVKLSDNTIYDFKIANYSTSFLKTYFYIRGNDNSEFYSVSNRIEIDDRDTDEKYNTIDVYRGDCFTNTVTIRINRNFIDSDVPVNEIIVDSNTWNENYGGYVDTEAEDWLKINRADINTVPLGMWITFKCLSNYNLGLRSEDRTNTDEMALMGNARSFYPLSNISTGVSYKVGESWLLNDGYNSTLGVKRNILAPNLPYIKELFDNRIMFSNVQVDDEFRNAYRIFQGLSYKDIDRQYGAIVKLIPYGVNLFCVFEHGIGIIPINEKALIQTNTNQSIHMYGSEVIQNQITLITPDFGSIWPESIIRTPVGIYGVDTYAKKIWRYTNGNGFETISDMKIQRFLNDNILLGEKEKYPIIALRNVKTHFNNYKGDVMFTFYNNSKDTEWNFCYNERLGKWITRYSWTPLYSENINNIFYSLDKKRAEILAYIYDNKNTINGINTTNNCWDNYLMDTDPDTPEGNESKIQDKTDSDELITNQDGNPICRLDDFSTVISLKGYTLADRFSMKITSVSTSYINPSTNEEVYIDLDEKYFLLNSSERKFIWEDYIDSSNNFGIKLYWKYADIKKIFNINTPVPLYYKIGVKITPLINGVESIPFNETIGVVVDSKYAESEYNNLLRNGFYVHGRAGIFNEINYSDDDQTNQILPTKWYDKQEPFEIEFVANGAIGLHKIFNNLIIISNNVKPDTLEYEIIGDVYEFKKQKKVDSSVLLRNVTIKYDTILNQYTLHITQPCKDISDSKYGRLLGNMQYKEDSWYITMDPIFYKTSGSLKWSSTRIRDKYIKIRVKYTGEDIVIITALKTLATLSYA